VFFSDLGRFWAPEQDCALCGALSGRTLICAACEHSLPRSDPAPGLVARYAYAFPVDRLVQRFKFGGDLAVGRWLGERLAERAGSRPRPDWLVAPPLAAARMRERGFNQAHELARTVGHSLGIPVAWRGVARARDTRHQPGLGRAARRANLAGAFTCARDLRGRRLAIVDDVLTTGATAEALAAALRRAGAASVDTWVVARTPEPECSK